MQECYFRDDKTQKAPCVDQIHTCLLRVLIMISRPRLFISLTRCCLSLTVPFTPLFLDHLSILIRKSLTHRLSGEQRENGWIDGWERMGEERLPSPDLCPQHQSLSSIFVSLHLLDRIHVWKHHSTLDHRGNLQRERRTAENRKIWEHGNSQTFYAVTR